MASREFLAYAVVGVPALGTALLFLAPRRLARLFATGAAVATSALAVAIAAVALRTPAEPLVNDWVVVDVVAGVIVAVIGVVGLASVLVSAAWLTETRVSIVGPEKREKTYYAILFGFWAILLAVPLAGNRAAAWLLVEATTAASA